MSKVVVVACIHWTKRGWPLSSHGLLKLFVATGLMGAVLASTSGLFHGASAAGLVTSCTFDRDLTATVGGPFDRHSQDVASATTATGPGGAGSILFTDINAGLPGVGSSSVAWGDYDNDGDLDILLTGDPMDSGPISRVYRNDGAGVFTDINAGLPGVWSGSVAWGDYDNDGDLDILLTGGTVSESISRVYRNEGAGEFTDIDARLPGVGAGSVAWGDYDNDGDLDILLTGYAGSGYLSRVYSNDGAGVFTDINAGLPGVSISSVAWGDYDNDGDLDILLTGSTGSGYLSRVYSNDGARVFTDVNAGLPEICGSVAWGDCDNDGDLDILLTGGTVSESMSRVYRNDGSGVFTDIKAGLPAVGASVAAWGDCDNDGDLDILLTKTPDGYTSISRVYLNDGAGTFSGTNVGLPWVYMGSVAWGDYDNDGDLDILLTGFTSSEGLAWSLSRVYRNDGSPANTPPGVPGGLLSTRVAWDQETLSWSAPTDGQTPAAGLSYNIRIGTTPGGSQICSAMANSVNGYRRLVQLGNAQKRTSWTVKLPPARGPYYWSVQAVDAAFAGSPFSPEQVVSHPTSVDGSPIPTRFGLHANVPNPFNPATAISFDIPVSGRVKLAILDATGRRVRVLVDAEKLAGTYTVLWDGTSDRGRRVACGVYLCRMEAGSFSSTGRLTLIK